MRALHQSESEYHRGAAMGNIWSSGSLLIWRAAGHTNCTHCTCMHTYRHTHPCLDPVFMCKEKPCQHAEIRAEPSVPSIKHSIVCERCCVVNGLVRCAIVCQNNTMKSGEVCDSPSICLSHTASPASLIGFWWNSAATFVQLCAAQDADLIRCWLNFHKSKKETNPKQPSHCHIMAFVKWLWLDYHSAGGCT